MVHVKNEMLLENIAKYQWEVEAGGHFQSML